MPWHDPLRVAERICLLDNVSKGRLRFGVGRGLSRREYEPFRYVEMDESRGRFDEGTAMVIEALKTGFIEGDGPFFPQQRTEIRPRPERPFDDRFYTVASSDDSVEVRGALRRTDDHVRRPGVGSTGCRRSTPTASGSRSSTAVRHHR